MDIKLTGITLHLDVPLVDGLNLKLINLSMRIGTLNNKLDQLLAATAGLSKELTIMAGELDTLETRVTETKDAEDSAILLLNQLADMLRAAASDPARILSLADQLKAKSDALGAAVVANTPQAPA